MAHTTQRLVTLGTDPAWQLPARLEAQLRANSAGQLPLSAIADGLRQETNHRAELRQLKANPNWPRCCTCGAAADVGMGDWYCAPCAVKGRV